MDKNILTDRFKQTDKFLYHYTTIKSAMEILKSKKIKFSDMANSNDINESWRPKYYNMDGTPFNDVNEYMTICFTKDDKGVPGFARSSMWGHYADKGYGVCMVFDRDLIISHIPSDTKYKDIDYENYAAEKVPFQKTPEWKIEAEFRIAKKSPSPEAEFLDFGENTLVAIIMYYANDKEKGDYCFDADEFKELSGLFDQEAILCYTGNHPEALFNESLVNHNGETIWSSKPIIDLNKIDL